MDGEESRLYGSRWSPKGLPAIFASATLSLAVLERFVHTDPDLEPLDLVSVEIDLPAGIRVTSIALADLPDGWRKYPAPIELTSIGERWLREGRTLAFSVPSAIIPSERNFIINPAHADLDKLSVGSPQPFAFGPRMWKSYGGGGR